MLNLQGQVAIVTGGASGIGRALSALLAECGAAVIIADIDGQTAGRTADWQRGLGRPVSAYAVNAARFAELANLVSDVVRDRGRLDWMINAAGIAPFGSFSHEPPEDLETTVATNTLGVMNGTAAAYPHMVRQGSGHIVNVGSLAGLVPLPGMASYSASKASVVAFSVALSAEAASHGILVSVACPAFVATPIRATTSMALRRAPVTRSDPWFVRRLQPEVCARIIMAGVERRKILIIFPAWARLAWLAFSLMPGVFTSFLAPRLAAYLEGPARPMAR